MENEGSANLPNSHLAITSLIAGILGITILPFVGSLVALITGLMARKEIASNPDAIGGDSMALAGVVLGGIGMVLGVMMCCLLVVLLVFPAILMIPVINEMGMLWVLGI